jgi:hypothetical protein
LRLLQIIQLGLKIPPEDVPAAISQKWEVAISKDIRIAALASLIKATHLTLFEMLGYRYALSLGGYFVGRQILGEFFYQNQGKRKSQVLKNAFSYFREFARMVRPLQANTLGLQGTISDKLLFVCGVHSTSPWALVIFIRTSKLLSAVMIPVLDHEDKVAQFDNFLRDENETIMASLCRFEQGRWNIDRTQFNLVWPKTGILDP